MRAVLALHCLFCGSPDDVTVESLEPVLESKVDKYRTLLSQLALSSIGPTTEAPIDLPDRLKEAIEVWTGARG